MKHPLLVAFRCPQCGWSGQGRYMSGSAVWHPCPQREGLHVELSSRKKRRR